MNSTMRKDCDLSGIGKIFFEGIWITSFLDAHCFSCKKVFLVVFSPVLVGDKLCDFLDGMNAFENEKLFNSFDYSQH